MSAAVPIPVIQLLQVLTVALGAPVITGVIGCVEARLQGRRGPRVLQPYYDLAKLCRKEALAPSGASWFFLAAPFVAVAAYLTIPLLIGPGTISTLIVFGNSAVEQGKVVSLAIGLAAFLVLLAACLFSAPYLARFLSPKVTAIAQRLMGMILAAIAMQMIVASLQVAFKGMAG